MNFEGRLSKQTSPAKGTQLFGAPKPPLGLAVLPARALFSQSFRSSKMPTKLFLALLAELVFFPVDVLDQVISGICPIGFQLGGACALTQAQCPASLPRFECLNGVCCRDLRPLPWRLQPPVYPTTSIGTCVDSATNCALFVNYCRIGCYRRCMRRQCPATCGFCSVGTAVGGTGQLTAVSGLGLLGTTAGVAG